MQDNDRPAESQSQILDIYKIHVEMADRVSQRRENTNRLFVAILSGMVVLIAAMPRFAPDTELLPAKFTVPIIALTGVFLAASWFVVIKSYRQLNSGKFQALHELEQSLPFAFYTIEWHKLQRGENRRVYWKLTVVETFLPLIFIILFLVIGLLALTL